MLRNELIQVIIIFILIIVVVIFLIYRKTKVITEPIRNLVNHVNRITNGHLDERIDILGSKEITNLSKHFNVMIATIQEYYNELEEKVRERTAEISRQKEKIEKQNKHITDSINYAQNIQKAVLPPFDYISKSLNDFFILFRPRDIVSGDFYWFAYKNNHVVIAAVDCTGHGVPGAFMSMLGVSLLNEIVNKLEKLDSNVILNELRSNVIKSLRQTGKEGEAKDGMDMALCIINFEDLKLQYSGAHNHLYHVREKQLEVYKADRVPISFNPYTIDKEYTKHELELKKGDTFYIFSDGYPDQFGGPKNKKFGIKRLKELFVKIQDKSMYEQKTILEQNLDEWKKDKDQIDDILVIGFKI
jgi:serine phosphatase RsbU (regulator of sigma subunit)